jgi:Spy/CpxP family protein refolding chaperone
MDVDYKQIRRSFTMRTFVPSLALSTIILAGFSGSALLAQDQSAAPAAAAQSQPYHAPNPQHQARKMAKKLGLSSDQVAKIEPILADRAQQMQSVRSDNTLAPQDRKAKIRAIHQDSDGRIEAVLTDTQKQAYEQLKQSRKAHRQQQAAAPANS